MTFIQTFESPDKSVDVWDLDGVSWHDAPAPRW